MNLFDVVAVSVNANGTPDRIVWGPTMVLADGYEGAIELARQSMQTRGASAAPTGGEIEIAVFEKRPALIGRCQVKVKETSDAA